MANPEDQAYSITLRIKRTAVEYSYVRVPVNGAIMKTDESGAVATDEKGHAQIDMKKMVETAVALSKAPSVEWYSETIQHEPHPIQQKPGANERWS